MDVIDMVETSPRQWEAKVAVERRETTGERIQVAAVAAFWAMFLFVVWFFES